MELEPAKPLQESNLSSSARLDTAKGIAKSVRLSPFTIRRMGYAGKITEYKCGRAVRYDLAEVLDFMRK